MNKVTLKRLPIMGLSVNYARKHEGTNKITHYSTGFSHAMTGTNPLAAIKELIEKTEGPTDITLEPYDTEVRSIVAELVPNLLANDKDIEKALSRIHDKSSLHQQYVVTKPLTFGQNIFNRFASVSNKVSSLLNTFLVGVQEIIYGIKQPDYDYYFDASAESDEAYVAFCQKLSKIKRFPLLNYFGTEGYRRIHPCVYLSVTYEAGDEAIAEAALLADLRKYQDMDMILGHLAMPSRIKLADGIGSGKQPYVLFCFLFVDFFKIPGWNPIGASKSPQPLPGIRTAAYEGALGWLPELDYTKRYEVETIKVVDTSEANHKAYVDSYLDSLPLVNKIAKKHKSSVSGSTKE